SGRVRAKSLFTCICRPLCFSCFFLRQSGYLGTNLTYLTPVNIHTHITSLQYSRPQLATRTSPVRHPKFQRSSSGGRQLKAPPLSISFRGREVMPSPCLAISFKSNS